jgi:hypothetical protein
MPKHRGTEGGRHNMPSTTGTVTVKPIRPTEITFKDPSEMVEFINYATSQAKTHNEIMDRVRRELKTHQRSPRRK